MSSDQQDQPKTQAERRALSRALLLNVGLSIALAGVGIFADSSALLSNALDNASDAAVYALSLHNVTVESADEPPEQSAGGKYRQVITFGDQVATGTIAKGGP